MKKVLQILSLILVLSTVTVGVLVFAQAETTPAEYSEKSLDFNDLGTGFVTSIPGLGLSSASDKTGVLYEVLDDNGDKYVRWIQGTLDSAFNVNVKIGDVNGGDTEMDTVTFSVDLRADGDYNTTVAGTMRLRRGKGNPGWSDVSNIMLISRDGWVCAVDTVDKGGVRLAKLDTEQFHTFSFVANYTTLTLDAYVDGVLAAEDVPISIPSETVLGQAMEPLAWLQEVGSFNWQSNTNTAGDSSLLVDNIVITGGNAVDQVAGSPLILYANGGTFENRPVSYTPGTALPLPTPTREDARFEGWYTTPDFSGEAVTEVPATATGTQCYYAKWDVNLTATFVNGEETVGTVEFTSGDGFFVIDQEVAGCAWLDTTTRRLYHKGATVTATDNVTLEALPVYGPFTDGDGIYIDMDYSEGSATTSSNSSQTITINTSVADVTFPTEGTEENPNAFLQIAMKENQTNDFTYHLFGNDSITGTQFTIAFSMRAAADQPIAGGFVGYKSVDSAGPQMLTFGADGALNFMGRRVATLTADEWLDIVIVFDGSTLKTSLIINGLTYVSDESYQGQTGVARPFYFFINKNNPGTIQLDNLKVYNGAAYLTEVTGNALVIDLDGGTVEGELPGSYVPGTTVQLPTPTKDGATFDGYYDNPDFEGEEISAVPADATGGLFYYAKWLYKVTFDGTEQQMAGTITMPDISGDDVSVGWWKTETEDGWTYLEPNDTYRLTGAVAFTSVSTEIRTNTEGLISAAAVVGEAASYLELTYYIGLADGFDGKPMEEGYPGLEQAKADIADAKERLTELVANQEKFLELVDAMTVAATAGEKAAYALDAREMLSLTDTTYTGIAAAKNRLKTALAEEEVKKLIESADAFLAGTADLTPDATYRDIKEVVQATAEEVTALEGVFAHSELLSAAKDLLDSMNAAADDLAVRAEAFIAALNVLDIDADYETFMDAMAEVEANAVTDVTVPGVADVIEKYEEAKARLEALNTANEAFFEIIARLADAADYATLFGIVETAESLRPFVDPDAEGLADAEAALTEAETKIAALTATAEDFLAKVDELQTKTSYADRKSALAAANALLSSVDATYPGVEQAKQTLAEQEASLAANDAFVASFVAAVDDLENGLRVSDRYKAYAKASQLAGDAQLDLTNPAAVAAMEDYNAAVAAYTQLVNETNDAIADAIGVTAAVAVASQDEKPASVVSTVAQVGAGA